MMDQKFSVYIEDCLHRLDRGEDLLDVLKSYPASQEQLQSLLLVAMASRSFPVPIPNHTSQRMGKNQMLNEMETLRVQGAFRKNPRVPVGTRLMGELVSSFRSRGLTHLAPSYRLAMVALVLVMSGGFLTLNASASSQPGDMLYSLKLGMERVQLAFNIIPGSQTANNDQLAEGMELAAAEEFEAPLSTNRTSYVINGITYQLNLDGKPGVAAVAQSEAQAKYSPPAFSHAQTNASQGNTKTNEGEGEEPAGNPEETQDEGNQGKALGKAKSNKGKALGKNKDEKNKGKNK